MPPEGLVSPRRQLSKRIEVHGHVSIGPQKPPFLQILKLGTQQQLTSVSEGTVSRLYFCDPRSCAKQPGEHVKESQLNNSLLVELVKCIRDRTLFLDVKGSQLFL